MASNPIQRRARQSFLIGFLIALIIMAVVVVVLFSKISKLNEEKEALRVEEITVYTTSKDFKSGEKITADSLVPTTIRAELDVTSYLTSASFEYDEEGNPKEYITKVDIPMGTMITEGMITADENGRPNDERLMEYHMIVLPSTLEADDYVDIRIEFPDGTSYIVLSKKYVEMTDSRGIWMKMTEMEINTLNSAIVESYYIEGTQLKAVKYTEPGMQEAAQTTYAVNNEVLTSIYSNPNILVEAMNDLAAKWDRKTLRQDASDYQISRDKIQNYMSNLEQDDKTAAVEAGQTTENEAINAKRDEYIGELE